MIRHYPQMTRYPRNLPPDLSKVAFTVQQGRGLGLTRKRMRAQDLDHPFRGVRQAPRPPDEDLDVDHHRVAQAELVERCVAAGLVIPVEGFFTHITAARLWPLPLPGLSNEGPLHVGVQPPEHPPHRTGLVGHHISDTLAYVVSRHGHRLIDAATLFCQLSAVLRIEDLVAVGDALVLTPRYALEHDDRPWIAPAELVERVERFRGRGKARAAQALQLIRLGAESRPETLVRLAIRADGLPEPELNVDVYSDEGIFIGRADMLYRRFRVAVEYDGDQHRVDTAQFDRDVGRLDDFAAAGWRVVRITKRGWFSDRAGCVERIRQALIAAGWRG